MALTPADFMNSEWPGDLTLAEVIPALLRTEELDVVRRHSLYPDRVRLRFLFADGTEAPTSMTLDEVRDLARCGLLHISIDDGEGGKLVAAT